MQTKMRNSNNLTITTTSDLDQGFRIACDPDHTIDAMRYCYNDIYQTQKASSEKKKNVEIKKVIFNEPATIVFWTDGDKTIVKCSDDEIFDPEKGLAMAVSKKMLGSTRIIDKWVRSCYNDEADKEITLTTAMESLRNFSIRLGGKNNEN